MSGGPSRLLEPNRTNLQYHPVFSFHTFAMLNKTPRLNFLTSQLLEFFLRAGNLDRPKRLAFPRQIGRQLKRPPGGFSTDSHDMSELSNHHDLAGLQRFLL